MICKKTLFYVFLVSLCTIANAQKIDRKALVTRHNVHIAELDTLGSLTVGNGTFAYTADVTGMQTFPEYYKDGMPLGTESYWGWDTSPNTENYTYEETLMPIEQYGRQVTYSVQSNKAPRAKAAIDYFRANPHRIQLGNVGLELYKKNGELAGPKDLKDIDQHLNVWTGELVSNFTLEGYQVTVYTVCHQEKDLLGFRIESGLLKKKQLKIYVRIPYPTAGWADYGTQYTGERNYTSKLTAQSGKAAIYRQLDSLNYHVALNWTGTASVKEKEKDYFQLTPGTQNTFSFTCEFATEPESKATPLASIVESSKKGWEKFWMSGGAVDFTGSTDKRASELERRIILSQYLTKLQCTGTQPPQETGLTYNSWYGRPHLEMHWWHGVHFPLWGRAELLEKSLPWYQTAFHKAKEIAKRQGFEGARWQKMTDPYGNESPSSIGALLIWQQPHFITFAELMYRKDATKETLNTYKERVFATADFMASFAHYNKEKDRYELGPGVIPAQERFKATETYNPTYELAYWNWALNMAITWKERLGEKPNPKWKKVLDKLSVLPVYGEVYLAAESAKDSYTNPEFKTDHPSVLGTYGMLPETDMLNKTLMQNTFNLIWDTWSWEETWGWDFPMTAMCAARLGMPEKAIDALFMDVQTNMYLVSGHNYQEGRLPVYLPGNGGLLTAIAMMCAGWDGCKETNPGFPKDGTWTVTWEGLEKML